LIVLDRRARGRAPDRCFPPVGVLLAAGKKLVRAGLRGLLVGTGDLAIAGEAASGREAVDLASRPTDEAVFADPANVYCDLARFPYRPIPSAAAAAGGVCIPGAPPGDACLLIATICTRPPRPRIRR
jgi:hypothetical protein